MNETVQVPDSYADLDACDADGNHFQIQEYPNICDIATRMAMDNGCINREETTADFYALCEPVIGDTGVYHDDLLRLDDWIATLSADEKDILADGEETEMKELVAKSPTGGPDHTPMASIFSDIFEVM